jgi:hypothetical protein
MVYLLTYLCVHARMFVYIYIYHTQVTRMGTLWPTAAADTSSLASPLGDTSADVKVKVLLLLLLQQRTKLCFIDCHNTALL